MPRALASMARVTMTATSRCVPAAAVVECVVQADYDSWKEANLPVIKTHFLGADAANIVAPPELECAAQGGGVHRLQVQPGGRAREGPGLSC